MDFFLGRSYDIFWLPYEVVLCTLHRFHGFDLIYVEDNLKEDIV